MFTEPSRSVTQNLRGVTREEVILSRISESSKGHKRLVQNQSSQVSSAELMEAQFDKTFPDCHTNILQQMLGASGFFPHGLNIVSLKGPAPMA